MGLKKILYSIFLLLLVVNFITYTFLTYTLYMDGTESKGTDKVKSHQLMYIIQLIVYLAQFGIGAVIALKT